jgi:PAS domain S-box-containing protein
MSLETVKVPEAFEPIFRKAEAVVSTYFAKKLEDPTKGIIEIFDSRYVLVRAAALSVDFFQVVEDLFGEARKEEAHAFARNILYDLAHSIGKADAKNFQAKMHLSDPIERLSAGPIHFSFTGWAFVDIFPESRPTPDENYLLIYDHPYSFEAEAWKDAGIASNFPVCTMNAGYSSGWCEESFGIQLVAAEIMCQAMGDTVCRFLMAPPQKIEAHIKHYAASITPDVSRPMVYQIQDLFSRKRLEDNLRNAADKFQTFYDSSSDLIFIRDLDGNFIDYNQTAAEKLGYSKDEIRGKGLDFITFEEDAAQVRSLLDELKQSGCVTFEMNARTKADLAIPLEVRSRWIDYDEGRRILSVARDISEQKKAKEELEKRTYDLGERVKELRCLYNVSKLIENPELSFDDILHYTAGLIPPALQLPEIAGARIAMDGKEYVSKNFRPSKCLYSKPIVVDGQEAGFIEACYYLDKPDGDQGCFLSEEMEMIDTMAEQLGHMKERLNYTKMIREQKEELEKKNVKLREYDQKKSDFVSAVAHELRGPLATIRGGISLVLEGVHGEPNENQIKTLMISKNNIDRLVRIVNNLLDLSKIEAGKIELHREAMDICALAGQVARHNETALQQNGLVLKLELPADPIEILADADLLTQVFMNLIGNARKFTDAGFVEVGLKDLGNEVECWVKDTGIGIADDNLSKVFDKFQQVGAVDGHRERGTGLGLSISKGIVELHGGRIALESEPGRGTRFYFTLLKTPREGGR